MPPITRNVILDLLPAYIAGEASADTRALVDEFAEHDPQIARLIRSGIAELPSASAASTPPVNTEMQAMQRVRKRLRRQGWFLGFAIFFTLTAVSHQWDSATGFRWTMQEFPALAILLGIAGLIFWILYFRARARLKPGA